MRKFTYFPYNMRFCTNMLYLGTVLSGWVLKPCARTKEVDTPRPLGGGGGQ